MSSSKPILKPPPLIKEPQPKKEEWVPGKSRAEHERALDAKKERREDPDDELTEEEKFERMSETDRRKSLRSNEDEAAYQAFLRTSGGRLSFG